MYMPSFATEITYESSDTRKEITYGIVLNIYFFLILLFKVSNCRTRVLLLCQ